MDRKNLLKLIPAQGILPLFFYSQSDVSIQVLRALYHAGIRAVEYTNRGEEALENFKKMRHECAAELKGMHLGIGTIKNGTIAQKFIDAGADFIICPGLVEEVANVADKSSVLWIPGCMTPSEIIHAECLGAKMIKLFPGNILGPEFMSAIKELFPNLLFMPTGGVDLDKDSIGRWLKAGVCAIGMGSKLISMQLLEQNDYSGIQARTKQALDILNSFR